MRDRARGSGMAILLAACLAACNPSGQSSKAPDTSSPEGVILLYEQRLNEGFKDPAPIAQKAKRLEVLRDFQATAKWLMRPQSQPPAGLPNQPPLPSGTGPMRPSVPAPAPISDEQVVTIADKMRGKWLQNLELTPWPDLRAWNSTFRNLKDLEGGLVEIEHVRNHSITGAKSIGYIILCKQTDGTWRIVDGLEP